MKTLRKMWALASWAVLAGLTTGSIVGCKNPQETTIEASARLGLPPDVYQRFMDQYPGAQAIQATQTSTTTWSITFTDSGVSQTVTLSR